MENTYTLRIFHGIPENQYWEEFEMNRDPETHVISSLRKFKNPVNKKREKATPVTWEQGCLEEVCGSCSILVNGKPRQACTEFIERYIRETGSTTIILAPFTKFPLIRDLCVDRTSMFEELKTIRGWISVDGTQDTGLFGPLISPELQEAMYVLSTCMTCGCYVRLPASECQISLHGTCCHVTDSSFQ